MVSDRSEDWREIRHQLYTFSLSYFDEVAREYHDPKNLGELNNRVAELWRPLLAIAKVVDADSKLGLYDLIYQYALEYSAEASVAEIDDDRAALIRTLLELTSDGTEEFQLSPLPKCSLAI